MKWIVEIIDRETGEVTGSITCQSRRLACAIEWALDPVLDSIEMTRVVEVRQ